MNHRTLKEVLEPRCVIQENARRIVELRSRVKSTFKCRDKSPEARSEWSRACDEFRSRYDSLAFPGGYQKGLDRIESGDMDAIENALAFLEVRPYFFRSQYIKTKLTRLLKHALLTVRQAERLERVLELDRAWKMRNRRNAKTR